MPELPEVEVTCRNVARWSEGRTLVRLEVSDPDVLRCGDPAAVAGVRMGRAWRRAKLCVIPMGESALVIHLRMTGKLVLAAPGRRPPRLRLALDDGSAVAFEDVRRLGQAWLLDGAELTGFLRTQAPGCEPWPEARDGAWLQSVLAGKRGPVKPALMDGTRVAGVGNIGASETCWRARVAPERRVPDLSPGEWTALIDGLRGWVEDTLAAEDGEEIMYLQQGGANPFRVYGQPGAPCPRCATPIVRSVQSGRATFACPACQA